MVRSGLRAGSWAGTWVLDGALALGIAAWALAIRLPYHELIPLFNDEVEEIAQGFVIAHGRGALLVDASTPYNGALWNWLVAAVFRLTDYSLTAPRTLMVVIGALTVLAVYPLGRAWGGRVGGVLASALMATAAGHVLASHVAWSNGITPLFTTLAIWSLSVAGRAAAEGRNRGGSPALALAGLGWGLALQTHPSVLALMPGALIYLVWAQARGAGGLAPGLWTLLRSRWTYLGLALLLLVNLNLLAYNLSAGFSSFAVGLQKSAEYAQYEPLTVVVYLSRAGELLLGLVRALSGAIDRREGPADYLADPGVWPVTLLAALGVAWQFRRGNPLPVLLVSAMALSLPLLRGGYTGLDLRYLAPLLPVFFAGIGGLLAEAIRRVRSRPAPARSWPAIACLGLGALLLVLHPLLYLRGYYDRALETGATNAPIFQTLRLIGSNRFPDERIVLDRDLLPGPTGHRMVGLTLRLAIVMQELPYRWNAVTNDELLAPANRCRSALVVVASRDPESTRAIVSRLGLRDVDPRRKVLAENNQIQGVYRLDRLPDQRAEADPLGPCRRVTNQGRTIDTL